LTGLASLGLTLSASLANLSFTLGAGLPLFHGQSHARAA
jgi:hypothetical protein